MNDIDLSIPFEDRIGGKIQIEHHSGDELELAGWHLDQVLDDVLVVKYVDISDDGELIKRGSMWVPAALCRQLWRVGLVILAGPNCKWVKAGHYVKFPNDRGLNVAEVNGHKQVVFLNESRIFGIVSPVEIESTSSLT